MPENIEGLFFEKQILTAKGLGAFGCASLSDGILTGCDVTKNGTTLTMSEGWIIICGRPVKIPQRDFTISASSGTMYHMIKASVDLTAAADVDVFSQVTVELVSNASLSTLFSNNVASGKSKPAIATGPYSFTHDINMSANAASTWLLLFSFVGSTIGNLSYNFAVSRSMVELWRNNDALTAATAAAFDAQTITLPELYGYNAIMIMFRGNASTDPTYGYSFNSIICPYEPGVDATWAYNLTYSYISSSWYNYVNQRIMYINGRDATIRFTNCWYAGKYHGTANDCCKPALIYGLRRW